ncbi:MAG TPA: hypothetical protein VIV12_31120 [Streptosporangiaceae bacterium]
MAGEAIAIGAAARTGAAVVVALTGSAAAPRLVARQEIGLVPAGMPAQPFHAAVGLEMADAEEMVGQAERGVEEAAIAGLHAVVGGLPTGAVVSGVAVVVKAVSLPGRLTDVMRSHAWMHAAEGVLYREAVLAAARCCGYPAHAVEASVLPAAEHALGTLGRAAGRPWRRIEKDAARVAITLLP